MLFISVTLVLESYFLSCNTTPQVIAVELIVITKDLEKHFRIKSSDIKT